GTKQWQICLLGSRQCWQEKALSGQLRQTNRKGSCGEDEQNHLLGVDGSAAGGFDCSSTNHDRCCKDHLRTICANDCGGAGTNRDLAQRLLPRQAQQHHDRCPTIERLCPKGQSILLI